MILFFFGMSFVHIGAQCLEPYPILDENGNTVLIGIGPPTSSSTVNFSLIVDSSNESITVQADIIDLGFVSLILLPIDIACYPYFSITNYYGQECTYINGQLCEECPPLSQWSNLINCEHIESFCGHYLIQFLLDNQDNILSENSHSALWEGLNHSRDHIYTMDHVAIGTDKACELGAPAFPFFKYGLSVKGGVIADVLHIRANGWADFVFDNDYVLTPLNELQKYITENGKLKHFPSQAEFEKNGYDVYELKRLQQMSIEELFLYMIKLEEELTSLEEKMIKP